MSASGELWMAAVEEAREAFNKDNDENAFRVALRGLYGPRSEHEIEYLIDIGITLGAAYVPDNRVVGSHLEDFVNAKVLHVQPYWSVGDIRVLRWEYEMVHIIVRSLECRCLDT